MRKQEGEFWVAAVHLENERSKLRRGKEHSHKRQRASGGAGIRVPIKCIHVDHPGEGYMGLLMG